MKKIWKQRYQIVETLGSGGTGKVYRVQDLHLEKFWAMKELGCSSFEGNAGENRELQALKRLSHPGFPRIVDAFEEENRAFLVMDLVAGITLEERMQKGKIEEREILRIGIQIAECLRYLHEFQPVLLYLDVKPANIMLAETGEIKLVDLGSVAVKGNEGSISGTPGFASPEQIQLQKQGRELKEQTDIFSFGMVLYALAVGSKGGLPVVETGSRKGVFVRRDNSAVSVNLERIIERCTRGEAGQRYASIRDVKSQLEEVQEKWEKQKVCRNSLWGNLRSLWYREPWRQEKSILCTEGGKGFYIARQTLAVLLTAGMMALGSETGKEVSAAAGVEAAGRETEWEEEETKKLPIILRDKNFRKVLVREGCPYETEGSLLLELRPEEIVGNHCEIEVICREESGQRRYRLDCIFK